jgi:cyclic-di-GMP phosphodiesterase TipF (flagellum assembly factor)
LARPGTILVGGCIIIIAASLGIVLGVRLGFSNEDAVLAASLAAIAMILLQITAVRARERVRLANELEDLRRANSQTLEDLDAMSGRLRALDDLETRLAALEERVNHGLADELEQRLDSEIEAAKASLVSEMQVIESLVRQLAEKVFPPPPTARERPPASAPGKDPAADPFGDADSAEMLEVVRRSVEANRIDVYLQPVVTLPQRKARYYEALTRLRTDSGEVLMPAEYLQVAEPAGIMPAIDNLVLFRSVQIVRRLAQRNREIGIFCNISAHSLVDPDFFPQFVEFLEHNEELAKAIIFEFPQSLIMNAGPLETESLAELAQFGFRFSMDHVVSLDMNFAELADRGFRFLKVDCDLLLDGGESAGAQIHSADLALLAERFGLKLIAHKVESEQMVLELLDYAVPLAQGYLFSEPRPVRGDLLGDIEDLRPHRVAG